MFVSLSVSVFVCVCVYLSVSGLYVGGSLSVSVCVHVRVCVICSSKGRLTTEGCGSIPPSSAEQVTKVLPMHECVDEWVKVTLDKSVSKIL